MEGGGELIVLVVCSGGVWTGGGLTSGNEMVLPIDS